MAGLSWPLELNRIRGAKTNNAFGMVRNGGTKPHQGRDLAAPPGTPCYAIADEGVNEGMIITTAAWWKPRCVVSLGNKAN